MTYEEKVRFLRSLPKFKVTPISEVRAIAFAAKEKNELKEGDFVLGRIGSESLFLNQTDIKKILNVYPDLKTKLG